MNSPCEDIISLLIASNLIGELTGWAGRGSREPSCPDRVVTIYDTTGFPPFQYGAEQPGAQVRVRGEPNSYATTYDKAKEIWDFFKTQNSIDINGTQYDVFELMGDITPLGYDDKSRPIFIFNLSIIRKDVS